MEFHCWSFHDHVMCVCDILLCCTAYMCISTMYNYMKQLVVVYIYIELYTLGVKYLNHIVEVILFIYCCFPPFSLFLPFIPLYNYLKNHQRIKVKSSCLLIIFIYSTYWGIFRPKLLIDIFSSSTIKILFYVYISYGSYEWNM